MRTVYGYKNKLWEVIQTFTYTGAEQAFSLNPGKYLLICNGARGGSSTSFPAINKPYGGTSYGVLTLNDTKSFYAVVGGNGGDVTQNVAGVGAGGYNGGASGTIGRTDGFYNGAGGGGASDIRTDMDPEIYFYQNTEYLPEGFTRLSYIEATGLQLSSLNISGTNKTVELDFELTETPSANAMFGYSNSGTNFIGINTENKFYLSEDVVSTVSALKRNVLKFTRTSTKCSLDINSEETIEISSKIIDVDALVAAGTHNWYNWSYYDAAGDGGIPWGTWQLQPSLQSTPNTEITFNFTSDASSSGAICCLQNYSSGHYANAACTYSTGQTWTSDTRWNKSGSKYALDSRCNYIRPEIRAGSNNAGTKPHNVTLIASGTDNDETAKFNIFGIKEIKSSIIPAMTSYTAPSGQVIYSGEFPGRPAWAAFDGVDNKTWDGHSWAENQHIIDGNPNSVYVGYEFGHSMVMTSITIANNGDRVYTAAVQIRNNNEWTTVYSNINLPATYTKATYTFDQEYTGDAIRLCIVGAWSSGVYFSTNSYGNNIMEITVAGYDPSNTVFLSGKLYSIREYDVAIGDLFVGVPCKKDSTNEIGVYDLIGGVFYASETSNPYIAGDEIEDDGTDVGTSTGQPKTLLSRLIVAGGGGGAIAAKEAWESQNDMVGMGGGIVGGPMSISPNYPDFFGKAADQTSGASFGNGGVGVPPGGAINYGDAGHPGGGGGWYGGYAFTSNGTYSTHGAGGGSGYVLTESSYKPFGYLLGSEYYLTDTFMSGGHAESPSIIICKEISSLQEGDTIIIPPTGEKFSYFFPSGQYILKCWGGSSGGQYAPNVVKGGYAQGTLNLQVPSNMYCYVGGSGIGDNFYSENVARNIRPEINFNGGGAPGKYGVYQYANGKSGGGATDIRIGTDSLLARVIVAGGAGGFGYYAGGTGGGTTGTAPSSGYGDNPGPGTQTESPQMPSYPTINGGFGYGGNAYNTDATGTTGSGGGAGGGGWYGGGGTYPTNYNSKGGSGGSGYVLTEDSVKPVGYLLNESHYLSDTIMSTGGNNLFTGETKIEIDVIEIINIKYLAQDSDGIKYFDIASNEWKIIENATEITMELFDEYGINFFNSDTGLNEDYEIILYDPENLYTKANFEVIPNKQTVTHTLLSDMYISNIYQDSSYNASDYDVDFKIERHPNGINSTITTTVTIDKLNPDSLTNPEIYAVIFYSE